MESWSGSQIQGDTERINFIFYTFRIYQIFNSMQEFHQIMLGSTYSALYRF